MSSLSPEADYINAAKQAMGKAYAPYSNYPVGALIVTQDGQTFAGTNVENASYPEGNCQKPQPLQPWLWRANGAFKKSIL